MKINPRIIPEPKILASFVIFAFHGWSMWSYQDFETEKTVAIFLRAIIIFSASYFYLLSVVSEKLIVNPLKKKWQRIVNWIILTIDYLLFYYLWDSLKRPTLTHYGSVIFFLNFFYLVWNCLHWSEVKLKIPFIFIIDSINLGFSVLLFFAFRNLPSKTVYSSEETLKSIILAIPGAIIIAVSLVGFIWVIVHVFTKHLKVELPKT